MLRRERRAVRSGHRFQLRAFVQGNGAHGRPLGFLRTPAADDFRAASDRLESFVREFRLGGTSFPSQAESRVGAEPIGALNVMNDISVPPAGAQIPSELGRFRRQLKRDGPARHARTGAVLGIALTLRRACAGRMSGPLPSIHTRSPLHSGQGTRAVREHAVLCQTPHAGGGMSAFFEWRDVGKGRAWRRSLGEGRLDPIGTKSAKQFKTKRSLPFSRSLRGGSSCWMQRSGIFASMHLHII